MLSTRLHVSSTVTGVAQHAEDYKSKQGSQIQEVAPVDWIVLKKKVGVSEVSSDLDLKSPFTLFRTSLGCMMMFPSLAAAWQFGCHDVSVQRFPAFSITGSNTSLN